MPIEHQLIRYKQRRVYVAALCCYGESEAKQREATREKRQNLFAHLCHFESREVCNSLG